MFLVNSTGKEAKPAAVPTQPTSAAAGSLITPTIAHVAPSTVPAVSVAPPFEAAPSKITPAVPSSAPAASMAPPVEVSPLKAQSKAPSVIASKFATQEEAPVDDEAASAYPPKSPSKAVELDGVPADPENPAEGSDDDKDKPNDEQSHISMFQKIE